MWLPIAQIISAVILIVLVLLQERSGGTSGIFGGTGMGGAYQTRRGLERIIFWATVGVGAVFALLAILNFVL